MFLLNGQPLGIDVPFRTEDGTQYPSNWLRLSSAEEKEAIGITEVPDAPSYDDRFYWGPGLPKDLDQLKEQMVSQVKATANSLLTVTDWVVIRASEGVKPADPAILKEREDIRAASNLNEANILACTTVEQLASLALEWPQKEQVIE